MTADPFDLQRFRDAQEQGGMYATALAELRAGRKRSHWIWFVFPQLDGLGTSPTARRYAIKSLAEARAYLADAVLGPRLHECCQALLTLGASASPGASAEAVLGGIDALKLRSSMTLFASAAPGEPAFRQVLERYYDGQADAATERLLAATES
jgi:uncharacterized protein (DUF1810 family)